MPPLAQIWTSHDTLWLAGVAAFFVVMFALGRLSVPRVSDHKETEQLRSMVDAVVEGVVIAEDDRICEVNASFARWVGRPAPALAGAHLSDFLRGEAGAPVDLDALTAGSPGRAWLSRLEGASIPVKVFARAIGCPDRPRTMLALWDLRERLAAEEALRDSEARYRLLAEKTSDVILLQTSLTKPPRYVSPASRAVLGYDPAEMMGIDVIDLIHPEDRETAMVRYAGLRPGLPVTSIHRLKHKRGHWVWVEAVYDQSASEEDETVVVAALRDVTERQRQQLELADAKARAELAASAKTDFLGNMSHELRTPLTSIIGFSELMIGTELPPERRRHLLQLQIEAGRSLLSLINDILDYAEIAAGRVAIETVPFSVSELVESCRSLVSDTATRKGLKLETIIMPDVAERNLGDPARIRQVLLHLLNNAVKFTDSGSITIVVEPSRTAAGRIRFAVSDTGPGIAAAKLDGLFERFTQIDGSTSRRHGGTGLGLAIAKGLVGLMKGDIGVESEVGTGSVFWFDIALPTTRNLSAPAPASVEAFNPIRMRVLVAEDTPISQMLIASMLESKGHSVTVVDNGREALEALDRESFDIVLMDIQMPVMDGLQATRLIRQRETSRRLPVIALTANALPADVDRCLAAGADVHLPKPIDWNSLDRTMERLISAGYARGLTARAS